MTRRLAPSPRNYHPDVAAGALFRARDGRVLLVKPTYKATWEIPGGVLEPGESPRGCCEREVIEELGSIVEIGRLLVADVTRCGDGREDQVRLVYDGGVFPNEVSSRFTLPAAELTEWRLVPLDDVAHYASATLAQRIRLAHECEIAGTTVYTESGVVQRAFSGRP